MPDTKISFRLPSPHDSTLKHEAAKSGLSEHQRARDLLVSVLSDPGRDIQAEVRALSETILLLTAQVVTLTAELETMRSSVAGGIEILLIQIGNISPDADFSRQLLERSLGKDCRQKTRLAVQ